MGYNAEAGVAANQRFDGRKQLQLHPSWLTLQLIYTKTVEAGGADKRRLEFDFRNNDFSDTTMSPTSQIRDWSRPETGIRPRPQVKSAYYYVRVIQRYSPTEPEREGEIAWSSPIFVQF